ncbi:MAG: ribulose-phosphate 3-epimerase [Dehalococcoidales bacterium]|nr:ribulose-phosphate 3-epimerase [Dehalococcoidales bacterium]
MAKLTKVIPAILTEDREALARMVRQAETFCDYVQLDIMDGRFVPSRSVVCADMAALQPKIRWEAHLMVDDPAGYATEFREAGASRLVFHYEASPAPEAVISRVKGLGLEVGLALNPETPVAAVSPLLAQVDSVLLLTVNPGFYGSPFIPEVLDKVAELRRARSGIEIAVDGGIKEGNIARVSGTGVDAICVGSAVFLQPDPGESYRRLLALAQAD